MTIGQRTFWFNEQAKEYVADILETGRLSYGKYSRALESRFAEMHGCKYGVLANSGTNALLAAVQAYKEIRGWKNGSEVIIPSVTFVATANVVIQAGLWPVPVDINGQYFTLDTALVTSVITKRTVGILPVHLFGNPVDMLETVKIADRYHLDIVEDSCEAVLSRDGDTTVGEMGGVACFSFYQAHIVQAGVGGICITNDWDVARKIRSLVNHGLVIPSDMPEDGFSPDIMSRNFVFESVGHSARITEFEAAVALSQLDGLEDNISRRRSLAQELNGLLSDLPLSLPWDRPGAMSSRMMYPIVVRDGRRAEYRAALSASGIGTRDALPLINQPCYNGIWSYNKYPVAKWVMENGFYIGLNPSMSDETIQLISRVLHEV